MDKLANSLKTLYSPEFPKLITYMLQSTEYRVWRYIKWLWTADDYSTIRRRRELDRTSVARLILLTIRIGILVQIAIGLVFIGLGLAHKLNGGWSFGLAIILAYPIIWAHLITLPVFIARLVIIQPKERRLISRSKQIFGSSKALKIAVAGSYGKTSMKELLTTVLKQGKNVAATPANKNVPVSHAIFARSLTGKEDVLIIELGEGGPGDVKRFSDTIKPDLAVITGVSPAHLDRYKTLDNAAKDIFVVAEAVGKNKAYVNAESSEAKKHLQPGMFTYDRSGAMGWKVSDISSDISGIKFKLTKAGKSLRLSSALLGRHQIGPLALAAALGLELGLTDEQIVKGVKSIKAYEHRMEPYKLSAAWIIDDTYNGNLEGVRAGTELLKELKAKRKIYVTPGLVDQGKLTHEIHVEVGRLIAKAQPDIAVLMENSVTDDIVRGLNAAGFKGKLQRESDPLHYYLNLSEFIASGDVVLMQNDWTDNYR